ncbi:MAG: NADH-quinone oxidoreductase subunit NuoE [Deltaproteobacteria bacterium]|nr:NADH-quinone oxidoreductase subunit NuoE [Deltaproteobacteria bacterium]
MMTAEEIREIEAELAHYPVRRAGAIEALKVVQRHRGWISDDSVKEIAAFLGMSADEVDAVATFYNLVFRRKVGRHVILVCDSVSCWVMGYDSLRDRLSASLGIGLGETTADGRFTFLPTACLGACDRAPAMMVDEDLHGPVNPGGIDAILGNYR